MSPRRARPTEVVFLGVIRKRAIAGWLPVQEGIVPPYLEQEQVFKKQM